MDVACSILFLVAARTSSEKFYRGWKQIECRLMSLNIRHTSSWKEDTPTTRHPYVCNGIISGDYPDSHAPYSVGEEQKEITKEFIDLIETDFNIEHPGEFVITDMAGDSFDMQHLRMEHSFTIKFIEESYLIMFKLRYLGHQL